MGMGTALLAMIRKEYQQTFRDKRMVMLLLVAPVIQLIVLGYSVNLEVDRVPTVIADEDRSPESRGLAAELTAGEAFTHVGTVESGQEVIRLVSRGEVALGVIIPSTERSGL